MDGPTQKKEMFDGRCRVCLEYMENTILLYTTACINDEILSYLDILHIISNFKIESNDHLPQNICTTCAERAESSYEFKLLCERSNKILLSELSSQTSYAINKEPDDIKIEYSENNVGYNVPFKREMADLQNISTRNSFEPASENTIQFNFDNSMDFDCFSTEIWNGSPCQSSITSNKKSSDGNCFNSNFTPDLSDSNYGTNSNSLELKSDSGENSFYHSDIQREHESKNESSLTNNNNQFVYCGKCGGKFVRKINLIKHLQKCEKIYPKTCSQCDYEPTSYKTYIEHLNIHEVKMCKHCDFKIINPTAYLRHLQLSHSDKKIQCGLCKKSFFETKYLAQHIKREHPDEQQFPNHCLVCNFVPTSHISFIKHMKEVHSSINLKKCKYCDYSNVCNKIMRQHRRLKHADKKSAHCTKCDKKYFIKRDLLEHMKKIHNAPIVCGICLRSFSSRNHLKQHMSVHKGQKMFECKLCDMQFNDQSLLLAHEEESHPEQKIFKCPECGSNFKKLKGLNDHLLRVHKMEKIFKCTVCTKKFFHDAQLKEHAIVHAEVKNFDCDTCGKTFKTKYNLQVHIVLHTGEKPHLCKYCGKKFTQATGLKKHLTHHHNKS